MKLSKTIIGIAATVAAIGFTGCETHKHHASQEQLMSEARVSRADAERMALERVPGGTIKEGEIEREKGHLIWSFDVNVAGESGVQEVNVDAVSGKVLSVEHESAAAEEKEAKKEMKEKKDKDDDEKEEKK
jgi:uncharacterized membrane protein YkoI